MEYFLVALGVWVIWNTMSQFFEAAPAFWALLPIGLGVGGQCILDYRSWYLGIGLGGLAVILMRISDLLLVAADWFRVAVLRHQRTTR
jgi:hypothetical protein